MATKRVAFVTGGAQGIGEAITREFDARDYRVVVADINGDGASEIAAQLTDAFAVDIDVSEHQSVQVATTLALSWASHIDVLVNNAGIIPGGTVLETTPEVWDKAFAVNVRGMFNCSRALLPQMISRHAGAVVSVASVAGLVGIPNRAAYCATKGAMISLTRAMAIDYIRSGVTVNCVCPGTADTPHVQNVIAASDDPVATLASLIARQPIGRLATSEEIAKAVAYLASEEASYITGTGLVIDGGLSAG